MAANPDPAAPGSLRPALLLLAVALAAFGLVAAVHVATRARIAATAHAQALARLAAVLPGIAYDNDPLADSVAITDPELLGTGSVVVCRVRNRGTPVAVVLDLVASDGYSGPIRLQVGIAPDGTVLATYVVQHTETPGLGDFIDTSKSEWVQHFAQKSLRVPPAERWRVRKDGGEFDQYTGATVTSRAMVRAVARALQVYTRHRDAILAAPATIAP